MWATEDAARQARAARRTGSRRAAQGGRVADFQPGAARASSSRARHAHEQRSIERQRPRRAARQRHEARAKRSCVYTAHHDHLGIGTPAKPDGDGIYNGALDNASGVAAVLAIAQALAPSRRRSAIDPVRRRRRRGVGAARLQYSRSTRRFRPGGSPRTSTSTASTSGDAPPTWRYRPRQVVARRGDEGGRRAGTQVHGDRSRTAALLSLATCSSSRAWRAAVIGRGRARLRGQADGLGRRAGAGLRAPHYHQPSRRVPTRLDLVGAVDDAQLLLAVGLRIANAPSCPSWKPGDEFEAARKQASR